MADAIQRWPFWRVCLSELEIDVVYQTRIKHQATNAQSRKRKDIASATQIEDEIPIALIESTSEQDEGIIFQRLSWFETVFVVVINNTLDKGAADPYTFEEILQRQATDRFC